jgi:hypothetical protein
MPELPEKFRFKPEFLKEYRLGMKFPEVKFMENGQCGVSDNNLPLSKFTQWYANLGNAHQGDCGDPHEDWLE